MKKIILLLILLLPAFAFAQTVETLVTDTALIKPLPVGPDDTVFAVNNFTDGHLVAYYDQLKKHKALDLTLKNRQLVGARTYWYRNGQMKEQVTELTGGDEPKHTGMGWYANGQLQMKWTCPNDTCVDEYYYPDGKLKMVEKSSPYLCYKAEYCENGQLMYTPVNPNATEKIHVINYYCNGKNKLDFYCVAGAFTGPYMAWNEQGTLIVKGQFDDDPQKIDTILHSHWVELGKTGTWQYFDDNGKLTKEEMYKEGELVKTTEK